MRKQDVIKILIKKYGFTNYVVGGCTRYINSLIMIEFVEDGLKIINHQLDSSAIDFYLIRTKDYNRIIKIIDCIFNENNEKNTFIQE